MVEEFASLVQKIERDFPELYNKLDGKVVK